MATLVLTAFGTALGGPIGGALGAIAGRALDSQVFGSGRREGPRLEELKISTSSYGQPIARHYGRMRAAGTVIWSTEIGEQRETSGGGKGKPKITTYSYSVSFAVALASRPIDSVGRIWADGTLLRGAAGDMKTAGTVRIHDGYGDQAADPLIAAAEGSGCPAFRNTAYVVFEDLQLADFGNRIPALSFEIFAGDASATIVSMAEPWAHSFSAEAELADFTGFSWQGGSLGEALEQFSDIHPLLADCGGERAKLFDEESVADSIRTLPEATVSADEGEFGKLSGQSRLREADEYSRPTLIRYYDVARDYQPGSQRAAGRAPAGREAVIEFPGALSADAARRIIEGFAQRRNRQREKLIWRTAELDVQTSPGTLVRAPGVGGTWRIVGWEWRESGVEFELLRHGGQSIPNIASDPGRAWSDPDLALTPTILRGFEIPMRSPGQADVPEIFAAISSIGSAWPGAALYAEREGTLVPLDLSSRTRAVAGSLVSDLAPSDAVRFESSSVIIIQLLDDSFELASSSLDGLAYGDNRLLVGEEVIQFAEAEKIGTATWRLIGLLRGRGGTEVTAGAGHSSGSSVTLLDAALVQLDAAQLAGVTRIAAIGHADTTPVYANVENRGVTQRPLPPVHARRSTQSDGSVCFSWCRRARGAWAWQDEVDVPLVEQQENYLVGVGAINRPAVSWNTGEAQLTLSGPEWAALVAAHQGETLWVCQIGNYAQSHPLFLATIT